MGISESAGLARWGAKRWARRSHSLPEIRGRGFSRDVQGGLHAHVVDNQLLSKSIIITGINM